jgi:hypothetical protein|tara:strand:- start:1860 stop:2108 length:249 start_codon:yes stop_codon:yes gene_type:complete
MSKPKFHRFDIPEKSFEQLYELTGGPNAYKGFIIAYSTEKGEPMIHTKCDSQVTEYGLKRALETFLASGSEEPFEVEDSENT